jgi:GTP cyclohydrolase IB
MLGQGVIDVQGQRDGRNVPLERVGIKHLRHPVTVLDRANGVQHTTADVSLSADLPQDFKGTHMSRFIEVFNQHRKDLSMPRFMEMLDEIRQALDAQRAYGELEFPYFIEKTAPASAQKSMMGYTCAYSGMRSATEKRFYVSVEAPVTTVCPCSQAISDRGAHNQRGIVRVKLLLGPFFWIEDIIALIEASASSEVFTLLKREDEKAITERAWDNPRFVEDVVREVYLGLKAKGDFPWFSVEAENFESIHNHSAFARAVWGND